MTVIEANLADYFWDDWDDEDLVGLAVKIAGFPIGTVTKCQNGTATLEIYDREDLFESKGSYSIA